MLRIYTCTPVAFHANRGFFIRDTGLLCTTLRAMGAGSRAVMPLPAYEDDESGENARQLRVPYEQLESADWWRAQQLDGVILYSWAAPRYTPIARAIHAAGIRLVIHLDATEDFSRVVPGGDAPLRRLLGSVKEWIQNRRRAQHLRCADAVTLSAAVAEKLAQKRAFKGIFPEKAVAMPCPVSPQMRYDGTPKQNRILCIGRWNDAWQKRPQMLIQTLDAFYAAGGTAETAVYGTLTEELQTWHAALPPAVQLKVHLIGYVDNDALRTAYRSARICLCTSRFESSHIVSAEAVCCGCSIVTPPRPGQLTVVQGYTARQSGRVAAADTPAALAAALAAECAAWENGERNPAAIAAAWQPYLHADQALQRLFPRLSEIKC